MFRKLSSLFTCMTLCDIIFVVAVIFAHTWIKGVGVFPRVFVVMNRPDIHKNHCVGRDVIAIKSERQLKTAH